MSFDGNRFTHDQEKYSYTLVPVLTETSVTVYTYTVRFRSRDGTLLNEYTETSNDSQITLTPRNKYTPPAQSGGQFQGWATSSSSTSCVDSITIAHSTNYGVLDLYAVWKYQITWKNGDTTLSSPWVYQGTTPSYSGGTPTKASTAQYSYTFSGWSPAITVVTGPATYTAQFTQTPVVYTITYNMNGGGTNPSSNPTTYTCESNAITLADATRQYYQFDGWYSDSAFANEITTIPNGSTGNVTLWAKWTALKYVLTLQWDVELPSKWNTEVTAKGKSMHPSGQVTKELTYGANIADAIATLDPDHDIAYAYGYTYAWPTSPATMPADSVYLSAVYTRVSHNLTLYKTTGNTATTDTTGFGDETDWLVEWASSMDSSTAVDTENKLTYQGWHLTRENARTSIPTWTAGTASGATTNHTVVNGSTAYWDFKSESGKTLHINVTGTKNLTMYTVPFRAYQLDIYKYNDITITIPPRSQSSEENITSQYGADINARQYATHRGNWRITFSQLGDQIVEEFNSGYTTIDGFTAKYRLEYTASKYQVGVTEYSPGDTVTVSGDTSIYVTYTRTDLFKRRYVSAFYDNRTPAGGGVSTEEESIWTSDWSEYETVKTATTVSAIAPAAPAAWEGYTFSGWTTKARFGDNSEFAGYVLPFASGEIIGAEQSVTIGDGYTYYAVWEGSGKVTYNLSHADDTDCPETWPNGQTPTTEYTLSGYIGQSLVHNIIPTEPLRAAGTITYEDHSEKYVPGWSFRGWSNDGQKWYAYGTSDNVIAVRPGQEIIITAGWYEQSIYTAEFWVTDSVKLIAEKVSLSTPRMTIRSDGDPIPPNSLLSGNETWKLNDGSDKTITNENGVWTVSAGTGSAIPLTDYLNGIRPDRNYTFRGWGSQSSQVATSSETEIQMGLNTPSRRYALYSTKYEVTARFWKGQNDPFTNLNNEQIIVITGPTESNNVFAPGMVATGTSFTMDFNLTSAVPIGAGVFDGWDNLGTPATELYQAGDTVTGYARFTSYIQPSMTVDFQARWATTYTVHLYMGIPEDGYRSRHYDTTVWEGNIGGSGNTVTIPNVSRLAIPTDETYVSAVKQPMWITDRVYLGNNYIENPESLPSSIEFDDDALIITIDNASDLPSGSARIELFAEQRHATYQLTVWKGGENSAPNTATSYTKSITYGPHELSIDDFTTESEKKALIANGTYAFLGLSRTDGGPVVYAAGTDYTNAYLNASGAYPEEGDQPVIYYARWGTYVTGITETAYSAGTNGFYVDYTLTPSTGADPRAILTSLLPNEVSATSTQVGPNITRWNIEFGAGFTGGEITLTAVPANPNPATTTPSVSATFLVSSLTFENEDTTAGDTVILPRRYYYIRRSGSSYDLTVDLEGYSAVSGESSHVFGGWAATKNGDLIQQITFSANETEAKTVLAAWRTAVVYDLDGGVWGGVSQDIESYYTDYTGETISLTASMPTHKTRKFASWSSENLEGGVVPARAGNIVVHAVWTYKDLEWYWANTQLAVIGPFTRNIDETPIRYTEAHPAVTWVRQEGNRAIAINSEGNVISHITNLEFPPNKYATVEVILGDSTIPIWRRSYRVDGDSAEQVIDTTEIPKLIHVNAEYILGELYIVENNQRRELILDGNNVTVTIAPGETTRIYVGYSGDADWEIVAPLFTESFGFSTVDANVSATGDNNGNWVLLSNKYFHEIDAMLDEEPADIKTYKIVSDSSGNRVFREIYETWLAGTTQSTQHWVTTNEGGEVTEQGWVPDGGARYEKITGYGSVRVSERANAGQYAVVFYTYPENKERLHVLLMEVIDEAPSAPLCVITKYPTKDKNMAQRLYLSESGQPNLVVTKVRRSGRAQLTQSPMLTKSSQFNYIIDTGNLEKFTFNVTRTPPMKVDDSDPNHPENWSTNKWVDYVKTFFDQWQNANYNVYGERSGGYNLIFDPLISYNGYPKIDKNVFLSAPLEYNFNRAEVTLTLQFTVASMLGRHAAQQRSIRFYYPRETGGDGYVDVDSYNGVFTVPEFPADVKRQQGYLPACWVYQTEDASGSRIERTVTPGESIFENQMILIPEGQTATVRFKVAYREVLKIIIFDSPIGGKNTVEISSDDIWDGIDNNTTEIHVNCTAVGGGGGGGNSHATGVKTWGGDQVDKFRVKHYELGGGGGSGFVRSKQIMIHRTVGSMFTLTLGRGGGPEQAGGMSTVVYTSGGELGKVEVVRAAGGTAGTKYKPGGDCNPGGEHATAKDNGKGYYWRRQEFQDEATWEEPMKGSHGEPLNPINGVTGGEGFGADVSVGVGHYPSSGGGAAPINTVYETDEGKLWIVNEGGFNTSMTAKRIKSIGGSVVSQTIEGPITDDIDQVTVEADCAKYGGGGCSKLYYKDYELDLPETHVTEKVKYEVPSGSSFDPIHTLIGLFTGRGGSTLDAITAAVNGFRDKTNGGAIIYDTLGRPGADGVIILELLGDIVTGE